MKIIERRNSLPKLRGLSYDKKTIFNYRDSGKLLCMRLDLSYKCNLKCRYCYSRELIAKDKNEASYDQLIDIIEQGIDLGIKSVVFIGGEPLVYHNIFDILSFLKEKNIVPVMFTNAILITKTVAEKLHDLNVTVIAKLDGSKETQEILCGTGYYRKRQKGLKNLLNCGYNKYPDDSLRLGCASVVTNVNYDEIEDIWRYLRSNNIFPHVERMTVMNKKMEYLSITNEQAKQLSENLRSIDESEFGIQWEVPYPTIPGYNCSIFYCGIHINPYLEVSACPEMPPVQSLKGKKLKDIIQSDYFQEVRNIEKHITGKCSKCIYLKNVPCYGCRSKVFRMTGSIFTEDRECPVVVNKQ